MRGPLRALALMIVLLQGCGGRANPEVGFINQTQHTDAKLWLLWHAAQQNLSQQIDMNPLQSNASAQILPGDPRVWNASPRQLTVAPQPDVSSARFCRGWGMTCAGDSSALFLSRQNSRFPFDSFPSVIRSGRALDCEDLSRCE